MKLKRHRSRRRDLTTRRQVIRKYRKPLLLLRDSPPPTRINSNANFPLKLRRGRRLSVVKLNHSQAIANRNPILPKFYDKPLTFKQKPATIICKKRQQRREVLFAKGIAGSAKIKHAKWKKESHERCS